MRYKLQKKKKSLSVNFIKSEINTFGMSDTPSEKVRSLFYVRLCSVS